MGTAWGIDVGASGVKVVKLGVSKGRSELLDAAFFPVDGDFGPEWGPRLKEFLASRGMKPTKAVVSVAGKDIVLDVNGFPSAPPERLAKMVELYVQQFGERHDDPLVHDWGLLQIPSVKDEMTVLVAMAKDTPLQRLHDGLTAAGVSVSGFVPAPVAVYNTYVKCAGASDGVSYLIDVGEKSLSLALLKGNVLLFARNIAGGLDMFVEPLMGALEVKRGRAVRFLLEEGQVGAEDDAETLGFKAGRALLGATTQLAQLLGSSIKFCQVKTKLSRLDPERYVLCGGGARMRGLAEHLGDAAGARAELLDTDVDLPTDRLGDAARADYGDGLTFAAAVGAGQIAGDAASFPIQIRSSTMVTSEAFYSRTLVMVMSLVTTVVLLGLAGWTAHTRLAAEQARQQEISDLHQQYVGRQKAKAELDKRRELLETKIALALDQVEAGARAFQIVSLIQAVKPEAMWLKRIRLVSQQDGEGDDAVEVKVIKVDGVVEESKLSVATVEKLFETALATHPVVEKVQFDSQTDVVEAGRSEFAMTIRYRDPSQ